jgi:hypothetical protein
MGALEAEILKQQIGSGEGEVIGKCQIMKQYQGTVPCQRNWILSHKK